MDQRPQLHAPSCYCLVRSGPFIRYLGGSVHIGGGGGGGGNGPVQISYFYNGAAPVKVFHNRSQSGYDNVLWHLILIHVQKHLIWALYTLEAHI